MCARAASCRRSRKRHRRGCRARSRGTAPTPRPAASSTRVCEAGSRSLTAQACEVGTDVGGTVTDLVFYTASGELHCFKVPSTPARPGASILEGIDEIKTALGVDDAAWREIVHTHSSTVATNALIERKGAKIGMIVSRGFRDLFELQRLAIPHPMRFDSRRPLPLIPRALVREVGGRIAADGNELDPLPEADAVAAAQELVALAAAATEAGWETADLMTLDVGGTSADIGVIRGGRPVLSSEEHIADFPLLIPTIAVSSIGAGGGSILWLDPTGSLKVGPRSVGADPGPACYGTSGSRIPALTDAFLVAGLLAPGQRLGGKLPLQMQPAHEGLATLAGPLGMPVEAVADGAIRVANALMAAEASNVLARRGVDAPRFRMVAFGGAGPLVAALLAEEIGIDAILIPPFPGGLSALGAARADLEGDLVEPVYERLGALDRTDLAQVTAALQRRAASWIAEQTAALAVTGTRVELAADMRYDGQGYDVTVPLDEAWLKSGDFARLRAAFHAAHRAAYGHANETAEIWLKELRAHIIGATPKPRIIPLRSEAGTASEATRTVRLLGRESSAGVHDRAALGRDQRIAGPAVGTQMDT